MKLTSDGKVDLWSQVHALQLKDKVWLLDRLMHAVNKERESKVEKAPVQP